MITNRSRGTTGRDLTEKALDHGHNVDLLRSRGSKRPFEEALRLNPQSPLEDEFLRLRKEVEHLQEVSPHLSEREIETFADYQREVIEQVRNSRVDVAILAIAASDFGIEPQAGKIDSGSELDLSLYALPKIISAVRAERPDIFLVGFKLEVDMASDRLINEAFDMLLRDKLDLVVANVSKGGVHLDSMQTYILTPERAVIPVERKDLAETLITTIENRFSRMYFKSRVSQVRDLPCQEAALQEFLDFTKTISQLALFPPYAAGNSADFGFYAARTPEGTLISARGSSKRFAGKFDAALITSVDTEKRLIEVTTAAKKATLNGYIAHEAFRLRPEINHILHLHIDLPRAACTERESTPGTLEDWQLIKPLIERGEKVIQQPGHGVFLLLERKEDVFDLLEGFNTYHVQAGLYDEIYSGFTGRSKILDIFSDCIPHEARVLDLAAGTGAVSQALLRRGYRDITLCDASRGMLHEAEKKLADQLGFERFINAPLQELPNSGKYEAMILRQGINYIPPDELAATLKHLRRSLTKNGRLIFNSFNPKRFAGGLRETKRVERCDRLINTTEGNIKRDGKIWHGQRTEVFDVKSGGYRRSFDLNSFYPYTTEQFVAALEEAGFSAIKVFEEAHSLYFVATK